MHLPAPVLVVDLFPEERAELLRLLRALDEADWQRPTVCAGWSVKDLATHLLGDDLGGLSWRRDGIAWLAIDPAAGLLPAINAANAEWVAAGRRLSSPLLCELLTFSGAALHTYFASLDPFARGDPVSWAGPEPAPVWLDVAREYTERWHHQQQIRDALGAPPLTAPRLFAPALAAFVRALPYTFRDVAAADGTVVQVTISGPAGGAWLLLREAGAWLLREGEAKAPAAAAEFDQDAAWRLFTKGLDPETALRGARINGDLALARKVFDTVAIIA